MDKILRVGILKETKTPPDGRTPATPEQCRKIQELFPHVDLYVQSSTVRCYTDNEYTALGIPVVNTVDHCDILLGIKEVATQAMLKNKTYLFFSHTAKKQPYNRGLLQAMVQNNNRLIDYEYLTNDTGARLVAFGKWAGIVGAYNGLIAFGEKTKTYSLPRAGDCFDYAEMKKQVQELVTLPPIKILVTGDGRAGTGAMEILAPLQLKHVSPEDFLTKTYSEPVLCQINADAYVQRIDGQPFETQHFYTNPEAYEGTFKKFASVTDLYIACHYWDPLSPVFLTADDYKDPTFNIRVIADVSCDITKPIASTLRPSTITDPFYGYDPQTSTEGDPWDETNITVMAVDNLPAELPRDSSAYFGDRLIEHIYPALFDHDAHDVIDRATIAADGKLTSRYVYLEDFLRGTDA